ncbi:unnamed protein product [Didymodactylos carnosus]|uniref:Uncharacterized protein n=1 Tax=Didymodactylos carnosus TaxID=1234261 RepID=A0A815UHY7_9BILA|nr:unnamed protein product [Didymodactylos carnosus]CAF4379265.1 unnamed protein product [Didymodactylos carnosus]
MITRDDKEVEEGQISGKKNDTSSNMNTNNDNKSGTISVLAFLNASRHKPKKSTKQPSSSNDSQATDDDDDDADDDNGDNRKHPGFKTTGVNSKKVKKTKPKKKTKKQPQSSNESEASNDNDTDDDDDDNVDVKEKRIGTSSKIKEEKQKIKINQKMDVTKFSTSDLVQKYHESSTDHDKKSLIIKELHKRAQGISSGPLTEQDDLSGYTRYIKIYTDLDHHRLNSTLMETRAKISKITDPDILQIVRVPQNLLVEVAALYNVQQNPSMNGGDSNSNNSRGYWPRAGEIPYPQPVNNPSFNERPGPDNSYDINRYRAPSPSSYLDQSNYHENMQQHLQRFPPPSPFQQINLNYPYEMQHLRYTPEQQSAHRLSPSDQQRSPNNLNQRQSPNNFNQQQFYEQYIPERQSAFQPPPVLSHGQQKLINDLDQLYLQRQKSG